MLTLLMIDNLVTVSGIWGYMKNLIVDFVEEFGDMNLILGPVIDSNNDELWDRDRNNTRFVFLQNQRE